MKVTLEQIDELRNRVNVSYEEAKATLEKNDGALIKSIFFCTYSISDLHQIY